MTKVKRLINSLENENNHKVIIVLIFVIFISSSLILINLSETKPEYDELAYINHVETIHSSQNNWYLGDRNRMPLFNYLLYIFYSNNFNENMQYKVYQFANIFYTLILTFIYSLKIRSKFVSKINYYSCLIFTFFIPIISYIHDVVVEPMFYITYGIFCVYAYELILNPKLTNYLKFGIISVILYLLKATGLNLFISSIVFFGFSSHFKHKQKIKEIVKNSLLTFTLFCMLCSPYLVENYFKFNGHIFYNVNTTFYVWYDSWDEVENGTKLYGDRVGWPIMNEEEIPSLKNYLNQHSLSEIIMRFFMGFKSIFIYYFSITKFTGTITMSIFLLFCWLMYLIKKSKINFINNIYFFSYIIYNSILLLIGASWYSFIAPIPRFTILIFVPIYFIIFKKFDEMDDNHILIKPYSLPIFISIFLLTQLLILFFQFST